LARARGVQIHTFRGTDDENKVGGFVSSNPGFYNCVVTYDASSLYPSLVRSNNMSPETKVGMCYFDFNRDVYYGDDSDMLTFKDIQGHERRINRGQLKVFIEKFDLVLSANGCVFTQKTEGIFPEYMRTNYENRNRERKDIKMLNKENEELENEIKLLEKRLKQMKKSG
jgi:DNA polymerase elongation subunit (family B)